MYINFFIILTCVKLDKSQKFNKRSMMGIITRETKRKAKNAQLEGTQKKKRRASPSCGSWVSYLL